MLETRAGVINKVLCVCVCVCVCVCARMWVMEKDGLC
jgi:hypothetical protein